MFDLLLEDCQSYYELERTKGVRSLTPEDIRLVKARCRPYLEKAMGGPEEMKLLLKILAAPVVAVLTVFVWVCVLMLHISALILGLAGTVVALLGLAVLITYSVKNGIILLVIAFLLSPFGLPMLAVRVLGLLQNVNYALRDFIRCR